MKTKKSARVVVVTILCCIMAAVMTISAIEMFASSFIKIKTTNGEFSTFISYDERAKLKYEDSELFSMVLRDSIIEVTRMCVIRDQMETKGKYDSSKPVDVSAYANRTSIAGNSSVTAQYALDDLVKWGRYGFDFEIVTGSKAELDSYYDAIASGEKIANNPDRVVHVDEFDANMQLSDLVNSYATEEQLNMINEDTGYYTMCVLLDKYNSVNGRSLATYASDRVEYEELVNNLCVSATDLFYNYCEYTEYNKRFVNGATNLIYCYQVSDGDGKVRRYNNMDVNIDAKTNDEVSKIFTAYSKYVCFNPDKLQISSTVNNIDALYMKECLDNYRYTFGDGSRIWLAVRDDLAIEDEFKIARDIYVHKSNTFVPTTIVFVSSILMIFVMLILMTLWTGVQIEVSENGEKKAKHVPHLVDRIPFEIYLCVTAVAMAFIFLIMELSMKAFNEDYDTFVSNLKVVETVLGLETLFGALILSALYLVIVRKIKCKLIWNGSILKWCVDKVRDGVVEVYDNGQVIVRTWLPYLIFLCINLILVLANRRLFILAACIMDMAVGLWLYNEARQRNKIADGITTIANGDTNYKVDVTSMHGDNLALANAVNSIGDGISSAIETSMRDEKMKADLITNVSHDIKTPLTSIINYVDLLKRENIEDEKIKGYIEVLDQKSQRLKDLTNDLVEASKISSGNITLNIEKINLVELINQSVGEFSEKFEEKELRIVISKPEKSIYVMADSRGVFRVVENLYNNVYKYI